MSKRAKSGGGRGCWRGILFVLLLTCVLAAGTAVLGERWLNSIQGSGIDLAAASPDLNPVRRLLLQNYLIQHRDELTRPAGEAGETAFAIAAGATANQVASDLAAAGLLQDTELLLNYLRYYGLDSRLQTGQFTLNGGMTVPALAGTITEGSAQDVALRFLPGMRLEETAAYLAAVRPGRIDADEFLALARRQRPFDLGRYPFLNSLPAGASLEGYLFPDSYMIAPNDTAADLLDQMLQNFDRQVTPAMRQSYGAQGLSLHEAVTIASVIERETFTDEERPRIASVYINRVMADIPLQADPTVQYAIGYQADRDIWWKAPLSLDDLRIDHPYNTYLIPALPPGPIASPGAASLRAVAGPEQTDYLFFVLDCHSEPPGRHIFARTYEEHLANVALCR
jgi:UPF0755 protein